MTEPTTGKPEDKSALSPDEPRYIPDLRSANTTNGTMYGVQTETMNGDITIHNGGWSTPDLMLRRATDEEIDDVRAQFVPPVGLDVARRLLHEHHVVALRGRGSGRSFTARWLLVDAGCDAVIELNHDRAPRSVGGSDLTRGEGYLWDLSDSGATPFTDWEFRGLVSKVKDAGSRMVIILDSRAQAVGTAQDITVELTPPSAVEVALATIRRHCPDASEQPSTVLKSDFAEALTDDDPPEKAARAARLAIGVARGELDATTAVDQLKEDVRNAVAQWFGKQNGIEIPKAIAVALLEGQPFEEVMRFGLDLDEQIRRAELPEDKKLRPRRVFAKSKDDLLTDILAVCTVRDHPRHAGLQEETIRFERQDWAVAVLRHVWSEFPTARAVLSDWMCDPDMLNRFGDATRRTLCAIIAEIPAHDPLGMVDHLATRPRAAHRMLAATMLVHLADHHDLLPLVEEVLEKWTERGSPNRQWTAAIVYGSPFGRRDLRKALTKLGKIGRSDRSSPQNAVVAMVMDMLDDKAHREYVLDTVVKWTSGRNRRNGLHTVSLSLGMWITGFYPSFLKPHEFAKSYPDQVSTLVNRVLDDADFGPLALSSLAELAAQARWDESSAAKLVDLTTMITPNLGWSARRTVVNRIVRTHPIWRTTILHIFRTARRAQRTRDRGRP